MQFNTLPKSCKFSDDPWVSFRSKSIETKLNNSKIVPTHYGGGGGRSSVDFPFLAYLGYKTFGWVVVFIAVLILLR